MDDGQAEPKKIQLLDPNHLNMASIRALMDGGHSKCPKAFYFLEFGTLMVRHLVMIRRLMYHRHILTRDNNEIIKKLDGVGPVDNRLSTDYLHQ